MAEAEEVDMLFLHCPPDRCGEFQRSVYNVDWYSIALSSFGLWVFQRQSSVTPMRHEIWESRFESPAFTTVNHFS
jgi:hypothetical protein